MTSTSIRDEYAFIADDNHEEVYSVNGFGDAYYKLPKELRDKVYYEIMMNNENKNFFVVRDDTEHTVLSEKMPFYMAAQYGTCQFDDKGFCRVIVKFQAEDEKPREVCRYIDGKLTFSAAKAMEHYIPEIGKFYTAHNLEDGDPVKLDTWNGKDYGFLRTQKAVNWSALQKAIKEDNDYNIYKYSMALSSCIDYERHIYDNGNDICDYLFVEPRECKSAFLVYVLHEGDYVKIDDQYFKVVEPNCKEDEGFYEENKLIFRHVKF